MARQKAHKRAEQTAFVDHSLMATGIFLLIIGLLLLVGNLQINVALRERSFRRMEENVNTVIEEVTDKFLRDSRILNATADILSRADNFDPRATLDIMDTVSPLLETMQIRVLLPDNQILTPSGNISDASESDSLSFAAEVSKGEHVTNRVYSLNGNKPLLRHFVPILQDGQTAALLYGMTMLDELPAGLNIDNIYNATASVYIIDTRNGDFILDTFPNHRGLGNILDYAGDESFELQVRRDRRWDGTVEELMHLGEGYMIYRSRNTEGWQCMYYAPAGINEWAIAVSVPEREAFASVHVVRRTWLLLGVALVLATLTYYLWVSHNARRTLQRSVEQAVLREKLRRAEAADRAKTNFLSNMSHDIRTPMNAIIGFTTLALANLDNRERVGDYLRKILSSGNHLLSLINDILDMSRIESGKLHIEEKECSLSEIFRDMRNIIQTQMQSKQLNFFMDTVDVTDEEIYCDKLHFNQVLLNLLSNAIKFTPAGGTVSLTVRQESDAPEGYGNYEIRVRDSGIGMSPEFVQHIFEPFERERNSTVSGIQGTGLGMAITKNIVDAMGGTIEVHSAPGKGTEFVIRLSFRLQSGDARDVTVEALTGERALVVDDSFSACDSITRMLRQIGMRPEWTLHGREAVLRAQQAIELGDAYRVYLIDWQLPDLGGLEVVRRIRAIAGAGASIIIVTAYDWSAIEDEARDAGVTAFCAKPVFLSELRDTLSAAVECAEEQESGRRDGTPAPSDFGGTRLLLVEDNEFNREIASELLTESGFAVDMAEDGTVAVEKLSHAAPGDYELVLMDIQMPIMDGYEATRRIRALPDARVANIPIVAMTANAFAEDRERALAAGMNAHVPKPIDIDQLLEVLHELLGKDAGQTER